MTELPTDATALGLLVLALGARHGLDADHLATIDGLTRFNARVRPRLARACGLLFSLGHGAVVIAIALAVSLLSMRWTVPDWLQLTGAWVSIACLLALGILNLAAVLSTPAHEPVRPVGLKGRWLGRLSASSNPATVALIGALFAASFDTVSQAALFAVAGVHIGGWENAALLGLLFMLGMLVSDGINGYFIYRLIARADGAARAASRVMGLTVSSLSLLVAALGMLRLASPALDQWTDARGLALACMLIGAVLLSFVVSMRMAVGRVAQGASLGPLPGWK